MIQNGLNIVDCEQSIPTQGERHKLYVSGNMVYTAFILETINQILPNRNRVYRFEWDHERPHSISICTIKINYLIKYHLDAVKSLCFFSEK